MFENFFRTNDRIISVNGHQLEGADYTTAIHLMKDANQLNMVRIF